MKRILVLVLLATPAFADDIYRCTAGKKTIYQDKPCANARVIENVNALPPTPEEQAKALERARRDQQRVMQQREADARRGGQSSTLTLRQQSEAATPANQATGRPDRYYGRVDRYTTRTITSPRQVQNR